MAAIAVKPRQGEGGASERSRTAFGVASYIRHNMAAELSIHMQRVNAQCVDSTAQAMRSGTRQINLERQAALIAATKRTGTACLTGPLGKYFTLLSAFTSFRLERRLALGG